MRLNPFKAIKFSSLYWQSEDFLLLDNTDTKDKIAKTKFIMDFLKEKIDDKLAMMDQNPALYLLRIETPQKSVTSLIGEIDYSEREIFLPNEELHNDKLEFYNSIFNKYKMQINPVLTFYRGNKSIVSFTNFITKNTPEISVVIKGLNYKLWKIDNPKDLAAINTSLSDINKLYIADGHHRFALFNNSTDKAHSKIMVSVTDSNSIVLKSCHRLITKEITPSWRKKIEEYCDLTQIDVEAASNSNEILIRFRDGSLFEIRFKYAKYHDTAMHRIIKNTIIQHSFEIEDYNNEVFPIAGNMSIEKSDQIFDFYKKGSAIIFVPNLQISEFFKILDSGNKLPPTTTWFEPKIIDGFLISKYE